MSVVNAKDAGGHHSVHELEVLYDEARAKINRLEETVCRLEVLPANQLWCTVAESICRWIRWRTSRFTSH